MTHNTPDPWTPIEGPRWDSFRMSLSVLLVDSFGTPLWDSLAGSLWRSLHDSLWDSLLGSLRVSLWESSHAV